MNKNYNNDFISSLGMTCVENYLLNYLKYHIEISLLYVESFIPFNKIISEIDKYEYFSMNKIQDTALKLSIIKKEVSDTFIYDSSNLCIYQVNKELIKSKIKPWREDHFVSINKNKNGALEVLNDYPFFLKEYSYNEFLNYYDNKTIIFKYTNKMNYELYFNMIYKQIMQIINQKLENIDSEDIDINKYIDTILILRKTRQRVYNWFVYLKNVNLLKVNDDILMILKEIVSFYEHLYLKLSFKKFKNNINYNDFKVDEVIKMEKEFQKIVKKEYDNYDFISTK